MSYFERLITDNKLGIKNYKKFEEQSRKFTSLRMKDLERKPIKGNFDYKHLKEIHRYIFQDVFEWAGKDRAELGLLDGFGKSDERGNITSFVPGALIQETADQIFTWLKKDNFLKNCKNIDEFSNECAELFANLNALHPFREGNGRTQRIFLNELAKNAGYKIDLNLTSKENMIMASVDASRLNFSRIKHIIKSNYELINKAQNSQDSAKSVLKMLGQAYIKKVKSGELKAPNLDIGNKSRDR